MSIIFNGLEISTLRRNGVDAAQAYYMGHELLNSMSAAEKWMQNLMALKAAANDISQNGESSVYYSTFYNLMMQDATFPVQLRNVDSYTSVDEDKVLNMRLVGINFKDKSDGSGKAGLTFMAKHAHPKASVMHTSSFPDPGAYYSSGWQGSVGNKTSEPTALRTYMNSGVFWNTLPADLKSVIVEVNNKHTNASRSNGENGYTYTAKDKLWIPSCVELCGTNQYEYYQTSDGPQFPWFASIGTNDTAVKPILENMGLTNSGAKPFGSSYSLAYWWTRSGYQRHRSSSVACTMIAVMQSGIFTNGGSTPAYSILPCFSI